MTWLRALVLVILAAGCGGGISPASVASAVPSATVTASPAPFPMTITDDRGRLLTLAAEPRRVVAIAPSATEIVFAIGAGDRLVAVDDFSDFPAEAKALPKVGGTRTSPERIVAHRPDLILAVTQGNLAPGLEAQGQAVIVFDAQDVEGVYKNILLVGKVLGRDRAAQDLVQRMRSRIEAVAARTKDVAAKPRVLHEVDATDPARIFVAGPSNFIDSMITIAGGVNVAAGAQRKFPQLSAEEIVRADPEVIVLGDAKYGVTVESVRARSGWQGIAAVRTGRILAIDPDIVSRPGPRLADAVEEYARLLHPAVFR
ncbi:MAG: cobalamin-binding protein [Chloroflexi bacterium]|nr:cobalamin-binding protein [Chloroflexota bacterium]